MPAPSVVLTELVPPGDTPIPFTPDCAKLGVVRPFTFTTTFPAFSTAPTVPAAQESDASARPNRTLAGQWTGTPLRATVSLPRRTRGAHASTQHATPRRTAVPTRTAARPPVRVLRFRGDAESMEDGEYYDLGGFDAESDSEGEFCIPAPSYAYAYESISATEGLSGWSFEELRVECYAQSLIARGTRPPPAVQPSLAIPPSFAPRIVRRD